MGRSELVLGIGEENEKSVIGLVEEVDDDLPVRQ
jgi:hypothetical protein